MKQNTNRAARSTPTTTPLTPERPTRRGRTACVVIASAVLGAAFGPGLASGAVESVKGVVIKNTTDEPVPTTSVGTTQVNGTVGIEGTPNVTVTNGQADPIPVTSVDAAPGVTPMSHPMRFEGNECEEFIVPADKRLTIDHVAFQLLGSGVVGTVHQFDASVQTSGTRTQYAIPTSAPIASRHEVANEEVRLVADPNSKVIFCLNLSGDTDGGDLSIGAFTGTLTDV